MHIHILETGTPPAPLDARFGGYPAMMERMLAAHSDRFSFSATAIFRGAPAPAVAAFDGLLITGSPAGAYEGHDWIGGAERMIRDTAAAGKPQVGICFGHQLMAQAFGGVVRKSSKGWGVGVHAYDIARSAAWMTPPLNHVSCVVSHQDQVEEIPDGCSILAGSDFCPHAILEYAHGPAISFQPHPEFSHEFADALMLLRADRIPAERVSDGRASLRRRSDRDLIGRWIANFFLSNG